MTDNIQWPQKTRDMHNHHFDSTGWNDFPFRDDDIVISTYAKSGTTWMQQIIAQMLFGGDPGLEVAEMSPWIDLRVPPKEVKLPAVEAMTHRRFLKTHLPVDALVFSPKAKYLFFINRGTNGRWCELLSAEDSARYEAMAVEQLGEECAHWLATGQLEQPN